MRRPVILGSMRRLACLLCLAALAFAQDPPGDPVALAVGGRVLDGKREPAAGLTVQVWDALVPERFLAQGTTGPKGRFLVALRAGDLSRREHAYGPLLVVVQGDGIAQQRREVAAGARDVEIVAGKARVVRGKVLDADGAPAPALVVRGTVAQGDAAPEGALWVETTTGEDGAFALHHLPAGGSVFLEVIGDGFVHRARDGGEIRLPPRKALRARVVDGETDEPVAGAEFRTVSSLGDRVAGVADAAGRVAVPALATGEGFRVAGTVVAPGYAPAPVVLRDGDEAEVRLRAAPRLVGRVIDEKGKPAPGCRVTLRGGGFETGAWTDEAGRYVFDAVPRHMVDLVAWTRGRLPAAVRTNPGAAGDELTLQLLRGARVAGRVQRNGTPAMGVRVSVWTADGEYAFAYTDALGRYLLEGVPADAVRLFAREPGRRSPTVALERPPEGETLGPFLLPLKDRLPLRGRLVSDAGAPLADVALEAAREALEPLHTAKTDAEGRFDFGSVPVDEYVLVAEPPDHVQVYRRELWPGIDHEIVAMSRFGENTLVVDVALPERLGFVNVAIRRREDPRVERATRGTPVFELLPAGTYDVVVRAEGYLPARTEVEVVDGKLAKVRVEPQLGGALTLTATPGAVVAIQRVRGKAPPVAALELASGTRELRGFGPGTYRLIARAPGELIVVKEIELGPDKPPVALDLRGGRAATLAVTVENAVGEPVPDAELTLVSDTGFRWSPRVRTDADGRATLDRLFAGRVEVFAKRGNREGAAALEVEPGGSLTATVVVR
jgi:hypothetical protein